MNSRHLLPISHRLLLGVLLVLASGAGASANSIWYVRPGGAGAQTGVNWANAFPTVQQAISAGAVVLDPQGNPDQVWVAEGLYLPPMVGAPPIAVSGGFAINKSIKLYGGFKGTETTIQGRLGSFKRTILEGDINATPALVGDEALHVVNINGSAPNMAVVIDGFMIRNGYATGAGVNGGGIECVQSNLDLANCYVMSNLAAPGVNYGGGVHFTSLNGGVEPTLGFTLRIKACEFDLNKAWAGGAIYGDCVQGEIVNTKLNESQSTGNGAGVYLARMGTENWVNFANCVFYDNFCASGGTVSQGAGLYLGPTAGVGTGGNAKVVNCTFVDNRCNGTTLADGQALALTSTSQAQVHNSIFYYNNTGGASSGPKPIDGPATVTYSDVEYTWGGAGGAGNKNVLPSFVNYNGGNLALSATSLCCDAADYSKLPADILDVDVDGNFAEIIPWDLASQGRWAPNPNVADSGTGTFTYLDMGAYEWH